MCVYASSPSYLCVDHISHYILIPIKHNDLDSLRSSYVITNVHDSVKLYQTFDMRYD